MNTVMCSTALQMMSNPAPSHLTYAGKVTHLYSLKCDLLPHHVPRRCEAALPPLQDPRRCEAALPPLQDPRHCEAALPPLQDPRRSSSAAMQAATFSQTEMSVLQCNVCQQRRIKTSPK